MPPSEESSSSDSRLNGSLIATVMRPLCRLDRQDFMFENCGRREAGQQGEVGLKLLQRHEPHAEFVAHGLQGLVLAKHSLLDESAIDSHSRTCGFCRLNLFGSRQEASEKDLSEIHREQVYC